ncbi:MAG: D-tyrosyl-tRNA(Tyr) deacylase [Chloroflexaceae bacterium]|nr:D-tyrosyl-tRNA(Tyr) deacylase [Chloroflexaceae bacterium]NJL33234.1 D-tyrosyl-tRNA(Tyr) deacylase [Chloroflexaceae bacterium]NJO04393.1 D-tyrosyl-tRNA(Tyr) deacylase [Chloroflexaceae bacterium]
MRIVLQRVSSAAVHVDTEIVGQIGAGVLLLVGVTDGDTAEDAHLLAEKVAHLRIFADEAGRFNRSLLETGGAALVVSQFTLYADVRKGRRPNFMGAAASEVAAPLIDGFATALRTLGLHVETGRFGAMMQVSLTNDGPVTIIIDSETSKQPHRS